MGEIYEQVLTKKEKDDAEVEIWECVFGFAKLAVLKCAIELGIAEAIEENGNPMTLTELSSALKCEPSLLQRIMRFLIHMKFFREEPTSQGSIAYQLTPLSSRLMRHGEKSMAASILLQTTPPILASQLNITARVLLLADDGTSASEKAGGEEDMLSFASSSDAAFRKLYNEAMACNSRLALPAMVEGCPEVFDGIGTLVDVGGNDGTALRTLIKAFPGIIRGICFDLPHVVSSGAAEKCPGIEFVGGDMFDSVPKADAALIKWILHDWGDDECIKILKNCREAIPKDKGKVIIVGAIIDGDDQEDNKFKSVGLTLDIAMLTHTERGKERTLEEWDYVIRQAGFSSYKVKSIHSFQFVIEAFP